MAHAVELMLPPLDRSAGVPVLRQLYLALRGAILSGALPPGARLPPTRALAAQLGLARNTVVAAYDQLLAEGFIEGRVGAGAHVSRDLPEAPEPPPPPAPLAEATQPSPPDGPALDESSTRAFNTG